MRVCIFCPVCGRKNNDNWPIRIENEIIEGGCQECWEKQSDEAWWKMIETMESVGKKYEIWVKEKQKETP